MAETWLKPNRRALVLGMVVPTSVALLGLAAGLGAFSAIDHLVTRIAGWALFAAGTVLDLVLAIQTQKPRIGFDDGRLLVRLKSGPPICLPVEVAEGFLLTAGPGWPPGDRRSETQTANLQLKLADKAKNWMSQEVHPSLGIWCGSMVTIRGAWCEPLDVQLVDHLNRRLGDAKRQVRADGTTA